MSAMISDALALCVNIFFAEIASITAQKLLYYVTCIIVSVYLKLSYALLSYLQCIPIVS